MSPPGSQSDCEFSTPTDNRNTNTSCLEIAYPKIQYRWITAILDICGMHSAWHSAVMEKCQAYLLRQIEWEWEWLSLQWDFPEFSQKGWRNRQFLQELLGYQSSYAKGRYVYALANGKCLRGLSVKQLRHILNIYCSYFVFSIDQCAKLKFQTPLFKTSCVSIFFVRFHWKFICWLKPCWSCLAWSFMWLCSPDWNLRQTKSCAIFLHQPIYIQQQKDWLIKS